MAQQTYFAGFDDGIYEDPDTGEKIEVKGGKRK